MKRDTFIEDCKLVEFAVLGERLFFADKMELFDPEDASSVVFGSYDEAFAYTDGEFSFASEVDKLGENLIVGFDGGRGSSSSSSGDEQEFKFDHASGGGGKGDLKAVHFPAEFNDGEKAQSLDKALAKFRERHANSDHEYGITVDEDGYVHAYHEGGATSVAISGTRGQVVIHNHPNASNFSDTDLLHVSQGLERGIIASGANGDYIFMRTSHFRPQAFVRALRSARPKGKDYNDATDKWLRANQSKYGYSYEFRPAR